MRLTAILLALYAYSAYISLTDYVGHFQITSLGLTIA